VVVVKAITIQQPYAHLIATGDKHVENRTWFTDHRGWLGIHAGKGRGYLDTEDEERYPTMVFGALVAIGWLWDCVHVDRIPELVRGRPKAAWLLSHKHVEGPYCWILPTVYPLVEPVPLRGQRRLFDVPPDVTAQAWRNRAPVPHVAGN
jgi:hypothetical protein